MQKGKPLTDFQVRVAQVCFSLPAAHGFLLASGAALVAQPLTNWFSDQDLHTPTRASQR